MKKRTAAILAVLIAAAAVMTGTASAEAAVIKIYRANEDKYVHCWAYQKDNVLMKAGLDDTFAIFKDNCQGLNVILSNWVELK